jgi:hypothetical protein
MATSAKFCPNCGSKISEELKKPEEVTLDWLRTVAERLGYKTVSEPSEKNTLFLRHEKMAHISFLYQEKSAIIGVNSGFNIKKLQPRDVPELLATLNKANQQGRMCAWFVNNDHTGIWAYTVIHLLAQISDLDVLRILESFNEEVWSVLKNSGLTNYSP